MFRGLVVGIGMACGLIACGGGGGGGSSAPKQVDPVTVGGAGVSSYPELASVPANNQQMLSCKSSAQALEADIRGVITYERVPLDRDGLDYSRIKNLPARGVIVQAVDASGGSCSTEVIATTLTNGAGEYGLFLDSDRPVCIEVRAQLYRDGEDGQASWDVQLVDNTQGQAPYYLVDHQAATAAARPERNLHAIAGVTAGFSDYVDERAAAPFAVLDSICEAIDTVLSLDDQLQLPRLKINWSVTNTAALGEIEEGDIGGTFYQEIRYFDSRGNLTASDRNIYLLGDEDSNTDEYDPHVINHEFTHYLTSVLSRFDAPGGDHYTGDRLDPRVAMEEGFADAFAAISLEGAESIIDDARVYKDSLGEDQAQTFRFAMDRNFTPSFGWYSESTVHSTIYNLFDADNGGRDSLTLSVDTLIDVIRSDDYVNSDALITLFTYVDSLKNRLPDKAFAIDTLLAGESIQAVEDAFGSTELSQDNDVAGDPDASPVYLSLEEGRQTEACSSNAYGTGNKLNNGRLLRFLPASTGSHRFVISPVNNGRASAELYRQGRLLHSEEALRRGDSISFDADLSGEVILVLSDYDNIAEEALAPGRYCFNVEVES